MKTTLYYFSGTGNSLIIARDVAAQLGDATVVPLVKALREGKVAPADNIGVVFPVYIWGMPLVVADFLKILKNTDAGYFFAVCTFGGFPAGTMLQIKKTLKVSGIKLSAGFGVKMPGNYAPMYGAISVEKQQKMFAEAKEKVKAIAETVKGRKTVSAYKNMLLVNWLFTDIVYKSSVASIPKMDEQFFADAKCNSCGICVKVCPAKNVELDDGKPKWKHMCQQCLACLQWCPVEAIQFGKSTQSKKGTGIPMSKYRILW